MQLLLVLAALASLTSVALAAPPGWSPDSAQFYSTVAKEIEAARKSHKDPSRKNCDFSRAKLPAPTKPLPPVPQGQKLLHVTIGRGIQVILFYSLRFCFIFILCFYSGHCWKQ